MKIKENIHQQQFISWLERNGFYTSHKEFISDKNYKGIALSIPNGGIRNPIDVVMLKKEGMLTGASDVVIILPDGKVIWMEFKTSGGVQSQKQKDFCSVLQILGHKYYLVWSAFEATQIMKELIND